MRSAYWLALGVTAGLLVATSATTADGRGFGGYYSNPYSGIRGGGAGGWPVEGFDNYGFIAGTFGNRNSIDDANWADPRMSQPNSLGQSPAQTGAAPLGGRGEGYQYGAALSLGQLSALHTAGAKNLTASSGFGSLDGLRYFSLTYMHAQALATQRWYLKAGWFADDWSAKHPLLWSPTGQKDDWLAGVTTVDWSGVGKFLDWSARPAEYRYGDNVIYSGDKVFVDGDRMIASARQYAQQASAVAAASAQASNDGDWLPLGTFALISAASKNPNQTLQLWLNRQNAVRGNAIDNASGQVAAIQGGFDRASQRIAWIVGNVKGTVYETGLFNLTKDESPAIVHSREESTELVLLVRLKAPSAP